MDVDTTTNAYAAGGITFDVATLPIGGAATKGAKVLSGTVKAAKGRTLYRGDSRPPDEIFATGFSAKGGNAGYEDFVLNNSPSKWISTSESMSVARSFSARDKATGHRGWVYDIADPGGGIVARKTLRLPWLYRKEMEVSFEGTISPEYIRSARPTLFGGWSGPSMMNPGFGG